MNKHFGSNTYCSLAITIIIILCAIFSEQAFPLLSLERSQVMLGEVWRIFTCHLVHFGWAHTLMNLAAFLICSLILLQDFSTQKFLALFIFCCLIVGSCVYFFNPEYETYAGLSGVIHGLIVAGFLLNKRHPFWVNSIFIALVFAKIIYEHQANYQATQLQSMIPVAVAYDAHLYGAIAGLLFGFAVIIVNRIKSST